MEDNKLVKAQASKALQDNVTEIDLLDLLGFYLSKLPLLIAAVVVGALIAGLYTHFMVPNKYTASSRMYMVSASSDSVVNLSDLNLGSSLSNDYVELMKSRPVIEDVIGKLELDYSYEALSSMISLDVVSGTRIVRISVTSTDPQEAMTIANQMARSSQVQLPKVMEAPSPSIAEPAVLPTHRSSPSLVKNVVMGALLLLVVVLGVLTVIYLMDDTIKSSEDVEKVFGIMPLSVIPEGKIGSADGEAADKSSDSSGSRKKTSHKGGKK